MSLRALMTAIAMMASAPATAVVVVDQDAIVSTPPPASRVTLSVGDRQPPPGNPNPPIRNAIVAQSVTAGVAGTLDTIEVQGPFWNPALGIGHAFRMSLYAGDIGSGASLLGSLDLPVFAVPSTGAINSAATVSVNVAGLNFAVAPGTVFSFGIELLGPPGASAPIIIGNVAGTQQVPIFQYNTYAGGAAYTASNGGPFTVTPRDVGFRTFVDVAVHGAVPEPASWLMMITGFALTGWAMRRRATSRTAGSLTHA